MFGSFTQLLLVVIVSLLAVGAAFAIWTAVVYKYGPGYVRRKAFGLALAVIAIGMIGIPGMAWAAGTGSATFGELRFIYYDSGKTEIRIQKDGGVFVYAVLTSAQTTTMRSVYTSTPGLASGGSAAAEPVDGTDTLPGCAPLLGDLTD